ncbi:hypothetical protein F5Y06DRAFT_273676, partial [Hypoxylon sp. FL0890]
IFLNLHTTVVLPCCHAAMLPCCHAAVMATRSYVGSAASLSPDISIHCAAPELTWRALVAAKLQVPITISTCS